MVKIKTFPRPGTLSSSLLCPAPLKRKRLRTIEASLGEIEPFDAREGGLRRLERTGLGIYIGRLRASADIWAAPDEQILVRFSHACYKHYFRVILPCGITASQVDFDSLDDYLHDELYDWFDSARCDDF